VIWRLSSTLLKGNQKLTATMTVTNDGVRDGKEVVQLYIQDWWGVLPDRLRN